MSFEYCLLNDSKPKKLSQHQQISLISKIVEDFLSYHNLRLPALNKAKKLAEEIFFKSSLPSAPSDRWKAKVKICKLFMFFHTLKAYIWKNAYSNINSMFDVSGENNVSDNNSNKQKAVLVDILEKMNYQQTCDQIVDYALIHGELISFTAWKKVYQEYRRPIDFFKNLFSSDLNKLPAILTAISQGKNYWTDFKKIYDNPFIYSINPENFVFDVAQKNNWDNCPKIYRSFKTPHEIFNNKLFNVTPEAKAYILNLVNKSDNSSHNPVSLNSSVATDDVLRGSTVEVLEHWGDLTLPDGTLLPNWHAVIVARKFLVKFSKNERIINPFTYATLVDDPISHRGISPLYSILDLALLQENLIDRTLNLQSLAENPPLIAPEGFFDKNEIALFPGKIIEYSDNLSPNAAFKQLSFNPSIFLSDISFINDLMCEVSGIFPNMTGASEQSSKTATEVSVKAQGQLTRLALFLDIINQNLIIPNVKNVAKLCADFKSGIETIFINKDNKKQLIAIDDSVRQDDYKYTYSDRSAYAIRTEKANLLVDTVKLFAQYLPLNLQEIFVWFLEQNGVDNPERFINQLQIPDNTQSSITP